MLRLRTRQLRRQLRSRLLPGTVVMLFLECMTLPSRIPTGFSPAVSSSSPCKRVIKLSNCHTCLHVLQRISSEGFGMLESGCVSVKNEVNIMMKNIIDVVLGGFTYWIFGYGLSFGRGAYSNPFVAVGDFFVDPGGKINFGD